MVGDSIKELDEVCLLIIYYFLKRPGERLTSDIIDFVQSTCEENNYDRTYIRGRLVKLQRLKIVHLISNKARACKGFGTKFKDEILIDRLREIQNHSDLAASMGNQNVSIMPAGPDPTKLPPLPEFNNDWSSEVQYRWFSIYEMIMEQSCGFMVKVPETQPPDIVKRAIEILGIPNDE